MVDRLTDSAEAAHAHEFAHALGQTHMGHENPLALQFHFQMMSFAKSGKQHAIEESFAEEDEEDEDEEMAEAQWGRRRRRRRRWWRRGHGDCGRNTKWGAPLSGCTVMIAGGDGGGGGGLPWPER